MVLQKIKSEIFETMENGLLVYDPLNSSIISDSSHHSPVFRVSQYFPGKCNGYANSMPCKLVLPFSIRRGEEVPRSADEYSDVFSAAKSKSYLK